MRAGYIAFRSLCKLQIRRVTVLSSYTTVTRTRSLTTKSSPVPKLKTMKLNSSSFQSLFTKELIDLMSVFKRHEFELRIAGGAVRDLLMGKTPSDLDFATTATPDQMKKMFEEEGVRMINRRGEQHGTVTCRINDNENFEVTTLRIDVVTDGRHAEVEFTTNWQLDAERRDLTINAMFLGLDGTLYDYYGGQQDVVDRRVRFVGDATARIQEDFLRILRYFRFYGRIAELANAHCDGTLKAIRENAHGLAGISGERIWVEVKKIISGQHVDSIFRIMFELGVARHIGFPADGDLDEFARVWNRCADLNPQPMTVLAGLFRTEDQVQLLHERVRMSNDERELLLFLVLHRSEDLGVDPFDRCQDLVCDSQTPWKTKLRVCELLKYCNLLPTLAKVNEWTPPRFPVRGEDVLEAGVPRGPAVGKTLTYLRKKWKDSRYTLDAKQLLEYIEEAKEQL